VKFTIVIVEDPEDGGYNATVPALPGCRTFGESIEETLSNTREAIMAYVASLKKHREPIPQEAASRVITFGGIGE
jgi:predicted RNase H-like HicB family nuclease